jgi:Ca2+/H+ antiporter
VQVLVGLTQIAVLPPGLRNQFLGKDPLLTGLAVLGLALALGAIVTGQMKKLWPTTGLYLVTMVVMIAMRQALRVAFQRNPGQLLDLHVQTEWGPLLLFLACFVAGLWVVAWMVRLVLRSGEGERA